MDINHNDERVCQRTIVLFIFTYSHIYNVKSLLTFFCHIFTLWTPPKKNNNLHTGKPQWALKCYCGNERKTKILRLMSGKFTCNNINIHVHAQRNKQSQYLVMPASEWKSQCNTATLHVIQLKVQSVLWYLPILPSLQTQATHTLDVFKRST